MLNGSYKILYIYIRGDFFPIGCLTSNSLEESLLMLESSTRDNSNGWRSGVPTSQSFSISFSGILTLDDRGATVITYAELKTLKRARTKIQWKIDSSEGGDTDQGYGYITSLSESQEVNEAITFDGSIIGTGDPSVTEWDPPEYSSLVNMIPIYESAKAL